MANHPDHPDWFEVRFHPEAIKEFGLAFPELPPGDEVVIWIKLEPCSRCGGEQLGGLGAIDPEHITNEGLLVGRQLCENCLKIEEDVEEIELHEERVEQIKEMKDL